jgi:c-di-AMP phosphodiesterase-like protein
LEKFEIDMKWGSYLFMANIIASIFIALLMFLDRNSIAHIIIFVFFRVLIFSYLLSSFLRMTSEVDAQPFSLLFPHRKKNLSEFLIEDDLDEREGITLNDLIPKFKKFARLISYK